MAQWLEDDKRVNDWTLLPKLGCFLRNQKVACPLLRTIEGRQRRRLTSVNMRAILWTVQQQTPAQNFPRNPEQHTCSATCRASGFEMLCSCLLTNGFVNACGVLSDERASPKDIGRGSAESLRSTRCFVSCDVIGIVTPKTGKFWCFS